MHAHTLTHTHTNLDTLASSTDWLMAGLYYLSLKVTGFLLFSVLLPDYY